MTEDGFKTVQFNRWKSCYVTQWMFKVVYVIL